MSHKLWLLILALLAAGGILWSIEGALIGLWRVWLNPEASWVLKLMLPGTILAFAVVITLTVRARRQQTAVQPQAQGQPKA